VTAMSWDEAIAALSADPDSFWRSLDDDEWLPISRAAELLQCSPWTLRRYDRMGRLPARRALGGTRPGERVYPLSYLLLFRSSHAPIGARGPSLG